MRAATEREQLAARWEAINRELERLLAGRDRIPEGDDVGPDERALLMQLDRMEGRLGELRRHHHGAVES